MALSSWWSQDTPRLGDVPISEQEAPTDGDREHSRMHFDFDIQQPLAETPGSEHPAMEPPDLEYLAVGALALGGAASEPPSSEPPASERPAPEASQSSDPPRSESADPVPLRKVEIAVELPEISPERRREFFLVEVLDDYDGNEVRPPCRVRSSRISREVYRRMASWRQGGAERAIFAPRSRQSSHRSHSRLRGRLPTGEQAYCHVEVTGL